MPEVLNPIDKMQQQTDRVIENLSKVKYKIAVMSGKGGVGKTTVATNIAVLLASQGFSVGLLDADVDCPNVGKILGVKGSFIARADRRLAPIEQYKIKIASMSFFGQPEDLPHIFRGPIIHSAIMQMLEMTEWGMLDFLIIDMPPGTSDAALTVLQYIPIDGVIVVTTAQELSIHDAIKSINLARQFGKKIGIIENMTGDIFGKESEKVLKKMKVQFLGSIPLTKKIRESCDEHKPIVLQDKEIRKEFETIVQNLKKILG